MAITKAKKQDILAKLDGIKKDSESIVFVNFKGVTVKDTTLMRRALREAGVGYFVAKKTLIAKAFDGAFTGEIPTLEGEVAVAYSTDAIAPAQNVKDFAKKYKEAIAIAGGVFQGVYKNKAEMTEIASIPSLQVLRGMFAQLINSPRQRFAVVLSKVGETKGA
jgi:large subunit ribosomal protein L10